MAIHKVAQDVEADDKLIGPFSFRQFIYLIVVVMAIALAWGLSRVFIGLAILPLPIILVFGAMALPLRKDQPMEVYLAAVVSYRLKPRKRLWVPDGIESLVEITAPKTVEVQRTKDLSQTEAERRLTYLADIADSRGWSIRRAAEPSTSMSGDSWNEAQQTSDLYDDDSRLGSTLNEMIQKSDKQRHLSAIEKMHEAAASAQAPVATPVQQVVSPEPTAPPPEPILATAQIETPASSIIPQTNTIEPLSPPSTSTIPHQPVQPIDQGVVSATTTPQDTYKQPLETTSISTSKTEVSPGIMNLAHNSSLSLKTIQREADRISKQSEEEVYISLHGN